MSRLKTVLDWFTQDDEPEQHTVDTEFLREHGGRYKYVTVADIDGDWCRCDLCGQRFDLEEFPDLVEHVAGHNEQGAAEIDPFEHRRVEAVAEYSFIETVEPTGDRVENNEHKTETQTNV